MLFLLTSSSEIEPLLALEFLHRMIDTFEEFLGTPLLSSKIESNYDIVAQLLNEICDAGAVSTTEGNALRDLVEVEGFLGKFLGSINIPGFVRSELHLDVYAKRTSRKPGFSSTPSTAMLGISSSGSLSTNTPALPWRRTNVRHTSNELYVDVVETLSVTLAPSGRPLAAFAYGTIAFTSKISGVPELLLNLSSPSGKHNFESVMELPVFHPCVRLARWRERPGELSFIPPDGRFILAGYEVDLLPFTPGKTSNSASSLKLPVHLEMKTSLGPSGADFEVRVLLTKPSGFDSSLQGSSSRPGPITRGSSGFGNSSNSSSPVLDDLVITITIPPEVRNLSEVRASRGDTTYNPGATNLEWHIPSKQAAAGVVTLRCTVVGSLEDNDELDGNGFSFDSANTHDYNENDNAYQGTAAPAATSTTTAAASENETRDEKKVLKNKILMPSSTRVSFSIKGWLPSGIRVESLTVDHRKSRGLGEGVKPYKGVKYLTISRGGVEIRC